MNKSESIKELSGALVGLQSEIENVSKDGSNPHFKSRYATLPNVLDSIRGALNKYGLAVIQTAGVSETGAPTLETTLVHRSGEWISGTMPVLTAKQDMQGLGSAWTYARRYGLMAIVGVAADDDDGESAVGRAPHASAPAIRSVTQVASVPSSAKPAAKPIAAAQSKAGDGPAVPPKRAVLNKQLIGLYKPYLSAFPNVSVQDLLESRYQAKETKALSTEQLEDLVRYMAEQVEVRDVG